MSMTSSPGAWTRRSSRGCWGQGADKRRPWPNRGKPMAADNITPLMALDAIVLDTETTGLDPAKARIVEMGAVRFDRGQLNSAASFRRLVRPDTPIPPEATHIHAIDEATVSDARAFAEVWPELANF